MFSSAIWYHNPRGNKPRFPKVIQFRTDTAFKEDWRRSSNWFETKITPLIGRLSQFFPTASVLKFSIILSELYEHRDTRSKFLYVVLHKSSVMVGFSSPYLWEHHNTLVELELHTNGQISVVEYSVESGDAYHQDGVVGDHDNLLPLIRSYLACKDSESYNKWSWEFEHIGD